MRRPRIDLHTHSTASDGTESPAQLVRTAAETGLDTIALTDHDSIGGWAEARAAGEREGVAVVPGAELSCVAGGISLHLLAYLFDPEAPALRAELERNRDARTPRAREMVRRLAAAGHPISWEDVTAQLGPGATVGRPHIADALVAAGVVPTRNAAFAHLLHADSPFHVGRYATDPADAVRMVRAAGGVTVFAHPAAVLRGRTVPFDVIAELADAGLDGIEVDHRDHDADARTRLRAFAASRGLLVTGASDYHGDGRENRLGEHTTDPDVFAELTARAERAAALS